jgi:hypothetical protein
MSVGNASFESHQANGDNSITSHARSLFVYPEMVIGMVGQECVDLPGA